MYVVVAVVAHEHEYILPGSGIGVVGIGDGLVYHGAGLFGRCHGETPHCHIALVAAEQVGALAIVQESVVAVVDIAIQLAEGVLTLVAEQVVVGI